VNGIGKTSILDAIAILLSRVLPRTTPAPGRYQHFSKKDFRTESGSVTGSIWLDFDGNDTSYSVTETILPKRQLREDLDRSLFRQISEHYDSTEIRSTVGVPIALFYTTDRASCRFPRKSRNILSGRAAAYQGALSEKVVNYRSVVDWLKTKQALASEQDKSALRILEVTELALRRFLPAFGKLEAEEDPPNLYIRKNGVRLGIDQLSDGERSFLAMVIDTARHLAQANPGSVDPLREGKGIVLIDELELHLHPKWQRSSVEYLQQTFPGIQFITTTHSPFVIQSLRPGQLISLDPQSYEEEYADKSIEDITENVMGIPTPQKSERYQRMMQVAEQYYRLLRTADLSNQSRREVLKRQLDELSEPFSDDPAYMALLKVERETYLGADVHASS
jgi:predicted ATP-binding protein involved in virulence